ncbi:MAG: Sec-independent protein translocase subunit TatA [Pseudomonadota bacterium]|nr:Sec-independent protein translocase subunit TatA [Pseudomonadota bacterium]
MSFGITELLIVLAIVIVIFGAKRIKNLGPDLGSAIKGFRSALSDSNDDANADLDSTDAGVVENVSSETNHDDAPKQDANV